MAFNAVGIQASDTNTFVASHVRVTDSTSYGIELADVRSVDIANSLFERNGAASIRAVATMLDAYSVSIAGNTIDQDSTNAIEILSQGAGDSSRLSLSLDSNAVTTTSSNVDGVNLNWNGLLVGSFTNNTFRRQRQRQ